jgi:hypothetical protein
MVKPLRAVTMADPCIVRTLHVRPQTDPTMRLCPAHHRVAQSKRVRIRCDAVCSRAASLFRDLQIPKRFTTKCASSPFFSRVPLRRAALRRPSWPAARVQTEIGQTLLV